MTTLADKIHAELKRAIVARSITCPRTGEVLDVATAIFAYDSDGDPIAAISPAGLASVTDDERAAWRQVGIYLSPKDSAPFTVQAKAIAELSDNGQLHLIHVTDDTQEA